MVVLFLCSLSGLHHGSALRVIVGGALDRTRPQTGLTIEVAGFGLKLGVYSIGGSV